MYDFYDELIDDLVLHKDRFWCLYCERGLFFPIPCIEHADTEEFVDVEEGDGVVDEDMVDDGAGVVVAENTKRL
jgi:hypothetical protein